MSYGVPRVGSALEDAEATPPAAPVPAPEAPSGNLCETCSHAPVCAVRAAVRLVGGEGLILIGACPTYDDARAFELSDESPAGDGG